MNKYVFNTGLVEYGITENRSDSLKRLTKYKLGVKDIGEIHTIKNTIQKENYVDTFKTDNFLFDCFPHLFPNGFCFDSNLFKNCFLESLNDSEKDLIIDDITDNYDESTSKKEGIQSFYN